jgi:hypothetical protein
MQEGSQELEQIHGAQKAVGELVNTEVFPVDHRFVFSACGLEPSQESPTHAHI